MVSWAEEKQQRLEAESGWGGETPGQSWALPSGQPALQHPHLGHWPWLPTALQRHCPYLVCLGPNTRCLICSSLGLMIQINKKLNFS